MSEPGRQVDPWRFTGGFLRKVLSSRIPDQPVHGPIPWTPVAKPLGQSTVALLSSAGLSMKGDPPFDMEGERRRPTWGDPSWRRLRADATGETSGLHVAVTVGNPDHCQSNFASAPSASSMFRSA